MSQDTKSDRVSYPGGYDVAEIIAAVKLAAMKHVANVPFGMLDQAIVKRFVTDLAARHPDMVPFGDPYALREQELFDARRSLLQSHLELSWFTLAYCAFGLVAARSNTSIAQFDGLDVFLVPVRTALGELGIDVSDDECLEEIDRFLPATPSAKSVEASTHTFLSFVRFLHHAALRRRQHVTPRLSLPSVGLVCAEHDTQRASEISAFLESHGVTPIAHPDDVPASARLLVLLSPDAIASPAFWCGVAAWKSRPVIPMVVCLMPKAELYRDAPDGVADDLWTWLGHNVAVELTAETDRYVVLLRALDAPDPKQWWWSEGDAIELGIAVDVLDEGIPRPPSRREPDTRKRAPYPYALDGMLLSACLLASDRLTRDEASGRDARYFAVCSGLLELRQKPGGEPYTLPWYMLIYRAWLAFAIDAPGHAYTEQDAVHAEQELRVALFALGVGTEDRDVVDFVEAFARLPWTTPASTIAGIDERAMAFVVLVHHLSHAALARGQRMRLQHPACSCFVSYARSDEPLARDLVAFLEAKGADVWWDLNAITLGTPLDQSLRSAVADARFVLLVATAAADRSAYVRLEVETAIRQGLRIVAIARDDRLPEGLESLRRSAPDSFLPLVRLNDATKADAFASALAALRRAPDAQLRWLQSRPAYQAVRMHLAQARNSVDSRND